MTQATLHQRYHMWSHTMLDICKNQTLHGISCSALAQDMEGCHTGEDHAAATKDFSKQ